MLHITAFYPERVLIAEYYLSNFFLYNFLYYGTKIVNKIEQYKIIEYISIVTTQLALCYNNFKLFKSTLSYSIISLVPYYPKLKYLLGVLSTIQDINVLVYDFYLEYKTTLRCISFIVFILLGDISRFDLSNLDIWTCIWLLENVYLIYIMYIKYVNPNFQYEYPIIHVFFYYLATILWYTNILIYVYYIVKIKSKPTQKPESSGKVHNTRGSAGSGGGPDPGGGPPNHEKSNAGKGKAKSKKNKWEWKTRKNKSLADQV